MQSPKNENNAAALQQVAVKTVSLYLEKKNLNKDGYVLEHLHNLFREDHGSYGIALNEDLPYEFKYLCEQLMVLLCNPKISKKISIPSNLSTGEMLLRMVYFFENISHKTCLAALHLYDAKNSTNVSNLDFIITRYTNEMKEM